MSNMKSSQHGEIRKSSMGSSTNLPRYSKSSYSYLHEQGKILVRPTTSCPMVWVWFDYSLSWNWVGLQRLKDNISKRRYYLSSTRIKLDIPVRRTRSDRAFVFQLSKLLFKLNQLVQGYLSWFLGEGVVQRTSLLTNWTDRKSVV